MKLLTELMMSSISDYSGQWCQVFIWDAAYQRRVLQMLCEQRSCRLRRIYVHRNGLLRNAVIMDRVRTSPARMP
jgi:hypothetical protein